MQLLRSRVSSVWRFDCIRYIGPAYSIRTRETDDEEDRLKQQKAIQRFRNDKNATATASGLLNRIANDETMKRQQQQMKSRHEQF